MEKINFSQLCRKVRLGDVTEYSADFWTERLLLQLLIEAGKPNADMSFVSKDENKDRILDVSLTICGREVKFQPALERLLCFFRIKMEQAVLDTIQHQISGVTERMQEKFEQLMNGLEEKMNEAATTFQDEIEEELAQRKNGETKD